MGVAAREFITGINHKEINILANFIIQDLKNSDSSNFQNNLDHHLLPTQFSNQTPFYSHFDQKVQINSPFQQKT